MAEIPIQEKRSGRGLTWLLVVIAALAVAWMLYTNSNDPEPATTGAVGAAQHAPALVAWPLGDHA